MVRLNIKLLVMDVDGTLTDGKIYISSKGELMKAFNVKDGLGIIKLHEVGIIPVIITGRKSEIVRQRARELNITEVIQGVHDKVKVLKSISEKYECDYNNIAYIGDDENDLECIKVCGVKGCPADAIKIVKVASDYVCQYPGGNGAVREFIDYILDDILLNDDN